MAVEALGWLVEKYHPAYVVVVYIYYEVHHGRINSLFSLIYDSLVPIVVVLAEGNPETDEEAVKDQLPTDPGKESYRDGEGLLKDESALVDQ